MLYSAAAAAAAAAAAQALMPDGVRTLVVGGMRSQNITTAVASVEIFSSTAYRSISIASLDVLERFRQFILYPVGECFKFL
jgi:hypothetical protein